MIGTRASHRLASVLALLLAPALAGAATLVVNDAGADCDAPADHATIQAAVDAAAASGAKRIRVCPGTYAELVHIEGFRRLVLEADPGVLLVPPGPASTGELIEVVDSRRVDVRGFELDGAGQFSGAGIFVYGVYYRDSSGTIEGNTIRGIRPEPLEQSFAHAIQIVDNDPADGVAVKVRIRGNQLEGYGQMGLDVSGAASVRIEDNSFTGVGPTAAAVQVGAILRDVARGKVVRNAFVGHWFTTSRTSTGLYLENSSRVRVEGNTFEANYDAIGIGGPSHRNRITDNDVTGSLYGVALRGDPAEPAERTQLTKNRIGGAAGDTAIEIGDAARTSVSRNEVTGFATFVEDLGSETKVSKNTCDGVACP